MDIDKVTMKYIVQAIRKCFTWSDTYKSYFTRGRTNECECCMHYFTKSELELDHYPEPVVPYNKFWYELSIQEYYDRVWGLPVRRLCKDCHKRWTKEQRLLRKEAKEPKVGLLKECSKPRQKGSKPRKDT